jgi:putative ABC transport system permease protein
MRGVGIDTLRAFAPVLILGAALGMFVALSNAMEERHHNLALLRALGAPQSRLFRLLIHEGVTLAAAGVILGLLPGHLGAVSIGQWLADARHVKFSGAVRATEELRLVLAAVGLGVMAGSIPSLRAYLRDIARTLSQR